MDYLHKFSAVSSQTAALIIFLSWYVAAAATTVIVQGTIDTALKQAGTVFLAVLGFMSVMFLVSRKLGRTDIVDPAWGPAFVVAVITAFILNPYDLAPGLNAQTLVTALVAVWAGRLCYGLTRRLLRKPEDERYVQLRRNWRGNEFLNTYLRVFAVQALLATVIATAAVHVNLSPPITPNSYVIAGLILWLVGFIFEVVGDAQLKKFLANPANKGKLLTRGLWKYTRHPNYFGEATMWWGIFVIALGTPYGWLGIISPVVITYLLLYVSGVSLTEKSFAGKPGWQSYKARTSKFFPLPPNKE